jgi:RimJ/RimL family protein N-acetyltransferase
MQQLCPHILAKSGEDVIGYALAMVPDLRQDIPSLTPLFELIDRLLVQSKYLVMGQICIDKSFRGKGVFRGIYQYYRDQLHDEYDCLVTEVSNENQRSLRAHLHVGFEELCRHVEGKELWITLVWHW